MEGLPPEIVDMVFDSIRPCDFHKKTLFSCSLVSKAWRAAALKHCFHSLSLFSRIQSYPETCYFNSFVQDFVDSDIFATVKYFVQELTLKCGKIYGNHIELDIVVYLHRFPALRHLELSGRVHERLSPDIPPPVLPTSLSTLTIIGRVGSARGTDRTHNIKALYDLLSLFRPVRHVYLRSFRHWDGNRLSSDLDVSLLPELRSLTLHNLPVEPPLTGLLICDPIVRCIERFELNYETTFAGLALLQLCKPDIAHLTFALASEECE